MGFNSGFKGLSTPDCMPELRWRKLEQETAYAYTSDLSTDDVTHYCTRILFFGVRIGHKMEIYSRRILVGMYPFQARNS